MRSRIPGDFVSRQRLVNTSAADRAEGRRHQAYTLELDGPLPFAVLDASDDKSRRGADIPLRLDLATELRQWIDERLCDKQSEARAKGEDIPSELSRGLAVFDVPDGLLRILDRDLKLADIPKKDDRGRTVDIHAMRHTFGTHLSKSGVAPRIAQAAMRHSSIDLTMNVYTDPRLLDIHGALDSLPPLSLDGSTDNTHAEAMATGTDNTTLHQFAPESGNWCKPLSIVGNLGDLPSDAKNNENPGGASVSQGFDESGRLDLNQRSLRPHETVRGAQL